MCGDASVSPVCDEDRAVLKPVHDTPDPLLAGDHEWAPFFGHSAAMDVLTAATAPDLVSDLV